jgi:hypothetical protein
MHGVVDRRSSGVGPASEFAWRRRGGVVWLRLSMYAALFSATASAAALGSIDRIYGQETPSFIDQAIAQDCVNLALVAPILIVLALQAGKGSMGAYLGWLGFLAFDVYNYVIYTFSIHFGPLFGIWVVVLGLCLYALIGGFLALKLEATRAQYRYGDVRSVGWFLIVVAALFYLLWLKEIVPATLSGQASRSAAELALPTNPVHILDLAFFLPAIVLAGVLLLRDRSLGYAAAIVLLVFLILTALPILVTPFVAHARGDTAGWAVMVPIGVLAMAGGIMLARLIRPARRAGVQRNSMC